MSCFSNALASVHCLFIVALWSPAGKGLTSWLLFVMSNCDFVTFPFSIHVQVCYLFVLSPDFSGRSYFNPLYLGIP